MPEGDLVVIATRGRQAVGVHLFTHVTTTATALKQTSDVAGEGEGSPSTSTKNQAALRNGLTASGDGLPFNGKAAGARWNQALIASKLRRP